MDLPSPRTAYGVPCCFALPGVQKGAASSRLAWHADRGILRRICLKRFLAFNKHHPKTGDSHGNCKF